MESLDGYLLDGVPSKREAIAAALARRSADERAQPFYRALERLGDRVADEALLALRLVLAGRTANDDAVAALRDLRARAARGDAEARDGYRRTLGAADA